MKKERGVVEGLVIDAANWVKTRVADGWNAAAAGWNKLMDKTQPQREKVKAVAQVAKAKVDAAGRRLEQARPSLDAALDATQIAFAKAWGAVAPKVGAVLVRGAKAAAGVFGWLKAKAWDITVSVAWQIVVWDQRSKAKAIAGRVWDQRKAA